MFSILVIRDGAINSWTKSLNAKHFLILKKDLWVKEFSSVQLLTNSFSRLCFVSRFIKMLEQHGKLLRNYTQNIDTLEQVAGIGNVIECHGKILFPCTVPIFPWITGVCEFIFIILLTIVKYAVFLFVCSNRVHIIIQLRIWWEYFTCTYLSVSSALFTLSA